MNLRLRWAGFTLTELMIGIVVAAILITLAVPSFRLLVQNNRIGSTTNDFIAAINLARAEAVKRGTPVFICRTDDTEATPPACQRANDAVHSGNWSTGWLIYAVPSTTITTGGDYVDGTDVLVRLGGGASDGVRITSDTEGNYSLGYKADGMIFASDEARYAICDDRNESAGRLIRVPLTGRAFLEDTSVAADRDCSPI